MYKDDKNDSIAKAVLWEVRTMAKQRVAVNARFDDKIVFLAAKERGNKSGLEGVLQEVRGSWKNHPVFGKLTTKEIIEWLRGPDTDV